MWARPGAPTRGCSWPPGGDCCLTYCCGLALAVAARADWPHRFAVALRTTIIGFAASDPAGSRWRGAAAVSLARSEGFGHGGVCTIILERCSTWRRCSCCLRSSSSRSSPGHPHERRDLVGCQVLGSRVGRRRGRRPDSALRARRPSRTARPRRAAGRTRAARRPRAASGPLRRVVRAGLA